MVDLIQFAHRGAAHSPGKAGGHRSSSRTRGRRPSGLQAPVAIREGSGPLPTGLPGHGSGWARRCGRTTPGNAGGNRLPLGVDLLPGPVPAAAARGEDAAARHRWVYLPEGVAAQDGHNDAHESRASPRQSRAEGGGTDRRDAGVLASSLGSMRGWGRRHPAAARGCPGESAGQGRQISGRCRQRASRTVRGPSRWEGVPLLKASLATRRFRQRPRRNDVPHAG